MMNNVSIKVVVDNTKSFLRALRGFFL